MKFHCFLFTRFIGFLHALEYNCIVVLSYSRTPIPSIKIRSRDEHIYRNRSSSHLICFREVSWCVCKLTVFIDNIFEYKPGVLSFCSADKESMVPPSGHLKEGAGRPQGGALERIPVAEVHVALCDLLIRSRLFCGNIHYYSLCRLNLEDNLVWRNGAVLIKRIFGREWKRIPISVPLR